MSLIAPTANPLLEQTLLTKLQRRALAQGGLGELEPVAVRLGLLQHSLRPRFREPQLVIFAADHGLAVDGIHAPAGRQTDEMVMQILDGRQPVSVFARQQGLQLSVVDCGVATRLPPHERLLPRKIAHGTRNARGRHCRDDRLCHCPQETARSGLNRPGAGSWPDSGAGPADRRRRQQSAR